MLFEVWDAAAGGGRGALLASGRLRVPVRTLKHREEQAVSLALEPVQGGLAVQLQGTYMLQKQWTHNSRRALSPRGGGWGGGASGWEDAQHSICRRARSRLTCIRSPHAAPRPWTPGWRRTHPQGSGR